MTKKDRRIADLEREVEQANKALVAALGRVNELVAENTRLRQRPPSLTEQARRKWNDWCDDLMRAVGL